jgi:hypothetical protein
VDATVTIMRFFTPEWRDGELQDEEYNNAYIEYAHRLGQIRSRLPISLVRFIDSISLHDGQIRSAVLDSADAFRLALRAGDLQSGYLDIDIVYGGVDVLDGTPSTNAVLSSDAEILQDEVDLSGEDIFEHRFLFAPEGELRIQFRSFEFTAKREKAR